MRVKIKGHGTNYAKTSILDLVNVYHLNSTSSLLPQLRFLLVNSQATGPYIVLLWRPIATIITRVHVWKIVTGLSLLLKKKKKQTLHNHGNFKKFYHSLISNWWQWGKYNIKPSYDFTNKSFLPQYKS